MKNLFTKSIIAIVAFFSLAVAGSQMTTAHAASTDASYSTVYKTAKQNLGKPYVWGATGPSAFDCSGFTGYVYKKAAKITIPRTAQAQYNAYKHVSGPSVKKGDLVFFGYSTGSISHVGLYVGHGKMIDAQNRGVVKERVHAPWWHVVGYAHVTDFSTTASQD
ncbi:cell wall-associated hydrolase [Secundilactobacillus pentosiphilus]|uniref:Cell wall-associated hydrolase n=1 Tax=Secundilactobacillus pentosiphilus TaxID=1714682 RepID=A0A1Z5ISU4_9LACO|nr:NlpC/P60 family protein [Secundilactobacillus pentosiphilus]GAX04824.1 cell wall-associated hydrolase [Secundilactobacillus pentosiphilus]